MGDRAGAMKSESRPASIADRGAPPEIEFGRKFGWAKADAEVLSRLPPRYQRQIKEWSLSSATQSSRDHVNVEVEQRRAHAGACRSRLLSRFLQIYLVEPFWNYLHLETKTCEKGVDRQLWSLRNRSVHFPEVIVTEYQTADPTQPKA
jgi:hypothetical protein